MDVWTAKTQIYFYRFGGPPDPLRTPLPGPGIDPQGPGTRSPSHPEHVPGTRNRRATNKNTKTPPDVQNANCWISIGGGVPKSTPEVGDHPGVLPVSLRFRTKSSSVMLLALFPQQYLLGRPKIFDIWEGFPGRRGRPDHNTKRFPTGPTSHL